MKMSFFMMHTADSYGTRVVPCMQKLILFSADVFISNHQFSGAVNFGPFQKCFQILAYLDMVDARILFPLVLMSGAGITVSN